MDHLSPPLVTIPAVLNFNHCSPFPFFPIIFPANYFIMKGIIFVPILWCFTLLLYGQNMDTTQAHQNILNAAKAEKNGDWQTARQLYEQSLPDFKASGNRERYLQICNYLHSCLINMNQPQLAMEHIEAILNEPFENISEQLLHVVRWKGKVYLELGSYQASLNIYKEANQMAVKLADKALTARTYNDIGTVNYYLSEVDSSVYYFEKALEINKKLPVPNPKAIANNLMNLASCFTRQGKLRPAVTLMEEAVNEYIRLKDTAALVGSYLNLGILYTSMGYPLESTDFTEQGLTINPMQTTTDTFVQAKLHGSKAINLSNLGHYDAAITHLEESYNLTAKIYGENHPEIIPMLHNLGTIEMYRGAYQEGLKYLLQAEAICLSLSQDEKPRLSEIYRNKGLIYSRMGQHKKAEELLVNSIDMLNEVLAQPDVVLAQAYGKLTEVRYNAENYEGALEACDLSIQYFKTLPNSDNYFLADMYASKARILEELKDYEGAKSYLDQSLTIYKKTAEAGQSLLLPLGFQRAVVLEKLELKEEALEYYNTNISEGLALFEKEKGGLLLEKQSFLGSIARKLELQYEEDGTEFFEEGAQLIKLGIKSLQELERLPYSIEERIFNLDLLNDFFESSVSFYLKKYAHTKSPIDLERAYEIVQLSKSNSLLHAIRENDALRFSDIPSAVAEEVAFLQASINYYQNQLELTGPGDTLSKLQKDNREKLFQLSKTYRQLVDSLEQQYPKYYSIKFQQQMPSVKELQATLQEEEAVIVDFFLTEESVHTFYITSNRFYVSSRPISEQFESQLTSFLEYFNQYPNEAGIMKVKKFADPAYFLYTQLLVEGLKQLSSDIKQLIIIPACKLGYVPFECLITAPAATNSQYKQLSYLIKKYRISYQYAAQLLISESQKTQSNNRLYAGFAPSYAPKTDGDQSLASRSLLKDLPAARKNVKTVAQLFQGTAYVGNTATKDAFLKESRNFRILHLAMHGILDDRFPLESQLIFTQSDSSKNSNEILKAKELFGIRLPADLVVLGACNTAQGQVKNGEGIISLSRAFAYAGCSSIVASLWSLPDGATADILGFFFRELKKGLPKDEALQKAKLVYLESRPERTAAPFYWAGLVSIGDVEPVVEEWNIPWWGYGMIGLIGALVLLGIYRFSKSNPF